MNLSFTENTLDCLPIDVYSLVTKVAATQGIDPQSSTQLESFFVSKLNGFSGTMVELENFLSNEILVNFRAIADKPKWIQNPAWPCSKNGNPMIFINQINIDKNLGLFHDDAAFYVFYDANGITEVIIQIA